MLAALILLLILFQGILHGLHGAGQEDVIYMALSI